MRLPGHPSFLIVEPSLFESQLQEIADRGIVTRWRDIYGKQRRYMAKLGSAAQRSEFISRFFGISFKHNDPYRAMSGSFEDPLIFQQAVNGNGIDNVAKGNSTGKERDILEPESVAFALCP